MESSRFPGKPLAKIHGMPMIGHCYFRARLSSLIDELYIATCDKIIYDYIISIGGNAIMTSDKHEMCMTRIVEAATKEPSDITITVL